MFPERGEERQERTSLKGGWDMKLAFITDEATQNFSEAVELAKDCGLQGLELRSVNDMPIDGIALELLREWKRRLDGEAFGMQSCVHFLQMRAGRGPAGGAGEAFQSVRCGGHSGM